MRMQQAITKAMVVFLLSSAAPLIAQTIYIPDTYLRAWLNEAVPGSVDAFGNCDTMLWNAAPPSAVHMWFSDVPDNSTLDLEGIQHLKIPSVWFWDQVISNISVVWPGYPLMNYYLRAEDVDITLFSGSFLPFPPALETISCENCGLTSIPVCFATSISLWGVDLSGQNLVVPASVTGLSLVNCGLDSLPLMTSVTNLYVGGDTITDWTNLPAGLETLTATSVGITELPVLPNQLVNLQVSFCPLASLLGLPPTLELLLAGQCDVDTIGPLPAGLTRLEVNNSPISELPPLPAGLERLNLQYTGITTLPAVLPTALQQLWLRSTGISALPTLPLGLTLCNVQDCVQLSCSPWLPPAMVQYQVSGSGITCIPNQPPGLNIGALGIPLVTCDILNPCPTLNPGMLGTSYIDLNSDGLRDVGEPSLPYTTLEVSPGNFLGGTGADGRYAFGLDIGTYSVTGIPALYQTISSSPATATFTAWQQVDSLNDVGYSLVPNIQDLVLDVTVYTNERPGFDSPYQLSYRNAGTQTQSGSLSFTYDPAMTFVSSVPPPDVINGNTLTWNFTALLINEQRAILLTMNTPVGTALGTPITHTTVADPLATDQTPADNTFTYATTVVGSYDPNDKTVEPEQLTPAQVAAGERVDYTIRFQNTGTFLAERVVITDSLSSDLQWNSMRLIASSHELTWYMSNGLLYLVFNDINLPDSTSDEPGSHGFVKFSMSPVSTLMLGATVENVANIYFDYNDPIITDPAVFSVNANVGLAEENGTGFLLYPNPVSDVLTIMLPASQGNDGLEVVDVTGRVVLRHTVTTTIIQIPVNGLKAGLYEVRNDSGAFMARFAKR